MESDRFDDVDFRMIEEPEPARPPRRRRRGLAAVAAIVVAGGLAAGASAIASPDEPTAPPAAPKVTFDRGAKDHHRGECMREGGRHHSRGSEQDTALRY